MKLLPNTILISFDPEQKQKVGDFYIVPNRHRYEQNARETNPVVAKVVLAGKGVPLVSGDVVVLHHNLTTDPVYTTSLGSVIPFDRWVLAKVDDSGELVAMPENILAERIQITDTVGQFTVPESARRFYADKVITAGGMVLGIRKWADYEVCYNWKGEMRRKVVLWKEDIVMELTQELTI